MKVYEIYRYTSPDNGYGYGGMVATVTGDSICEASKKARAMGYGGYEYGMREFNDENVSAMKMEIERLNKIIDTYKKGN